MIERLTLPMLLEICRAGNFEATIQDNCVDLLLDHGRMASLVLNELGNKISFCFVPNIEVKMDDRDDLMLVNAINAAFVDDDELPSFTSCIDCYDEDTEEDALLIRCAETLDGGVSEKQITCFLKACSMAVDKVFAIINGDVDGNNE